MTVVISKALRDEVMASAKALLPQARANLLALYTGHAERVAKVRRRKLTQAERASIVKTVDRLLKLS